MRIKHKRLAGGYEVLETYVYYSKRYNRTITVQKGFWCDGATGALDMDTDAWIIHDWICDSKNGSDGKWDDGTLIDNWTASTILGDVLWLDGYKVRAVIWWWATWLFGCKACRKNGLRRVKV